MLLSFFRKIYNAYYRRHILKRKEHLNMKTVISELHRLEKEYRKALTNAAEANNFTMYMSLSNKLDALNEFENLLYEEELA